MKRFAYLTLLLLGLSIGFGIAAWRLASPVEAQGAWQCRSWAMGEGGDAAAVGTWLGTAEHVQMTSAGLSAGSRFAVVACKK